MKQDSLGNRMKMYEHGYTGEESTWTIGSAGNQIVSSYEPVFVRIDGKAFSTWTKQMNATKPFSKPLSYLFQKATIKTCEEIGQVIMAYSQSDEVTFLLNGWQNPQSQIYFGGKVQKIASVLASTFTAFFNVDGYIFMEETKSKVWPHEYTPWIPAFFDARVWNVPENEIENVFIWRQMDAKRNSIQTLAQSMFSHKQLHGINTQDMKKMLSEEGIDWEECSNLQKWGFAVYKENYDLPQADGVIVRSRWKVDTDIPFFVDSREYLIEKIKKE